MPENEQKAPTPTPRSIGEARDEIEREYNLRVKMYPVWIKEGRLSRIDARDRLERLGAALGYLQKVCDLQPDPYVA